jgi:glucan phosphoethanolaminetransferase (alkaline phosphatase superfamily)
MCKVALYGTLVAVLATLAHVLHGISHVEYRVPLASWQWAFVIFVVFLAPVVAAILLWTWLRRVGVWLFLASMAGALIFGLAFHFLVPGSDNVFTLNPGAGREAFRLSAALVALTEALGCVVGTWALSKLPRSAEDAGGAVNLRRSSGEEVR